MALSAEFAAHIEDLFAGFGPVRIRRMFGGAGVFHDGVMIALVSDSDVYLRTDQDLARTMEAAGAGAFSYRTKSRGVSLPYWRVPEDVLEDTDTFTGWAQRAHAAALTAASRRRKC